MANGVPVKLHICDHNGVCLGVQTEFVLTLYGAVIQVDLHNVDDLIAGINQAAGELEDDVWNLPGREPGAFSEPYS